MHEYLTRMNASRRATTLTWASCSSSCTSICCCATVCAASIHFFTRGTLASYQSETDHKPYISARLGHDDLSLLQERNTLQWLACAHKSYIAGLCHGLVFFGQWRGRRPARACRRGSHSSRGRKSGLGTTCCRRCGEGRLRSTRLRKGRWGCASACTGQGGRLIRLAVNDLRGGRARAWQAQQTRQSIVVH